ncbi:Gfo/Idh/MocA family oxidoreductase [Gordonia sp. PKS22-38]|uniref:Gfo/Idh/MocA family oxidoreductase n=1 Tax=Gordonia prachuapensis TaxID=3115651 RepID=A0ABU7MTI4_9ACTN|nr:Gfo/Idh/MocA family oxidoreductase [Gordonia sp. PKS22-38]
MIRMATIGTSSITRTFLDAASAVDDVDVTTVYSRDADRAAAFASETAIAGSSDDLDGLLASSTIDAVYVASPNGIHAEQAMRAVRAGKHVLLEKPAVPTTAEFTALVDHARDHGVVVLEGMRNVHDPALHAIKDLIGSLGPVRRASFSYCQRSARYDKVLAGERVNIFDPALAGGALMDLGVYTIAAMVEFFGKPRLVAGASVPIAGGADGAGSALAVYDGLVVDLSYSKISASQRPDEIQGELGTLTFDHVAQPTVAQIRLHDGTVTDHSFDGPANNMVHEIRKFAAIVGGTADPTADHERTAGVLDVVEMIGQAQVG